MTALYHGLYQPAMPGSERGLLVCAAEDEPFAVGGRQAAPDARTLLRLAVGRDDPRRGGRGGLDLLLALRPTAVERPGPAGRDRRSELIPGVHGDGPLVAELGGPPQQQILEGSELDGQPGRGRVQGYRRLLAAEPGGHQRRARRQVSRAEL